MGNTKEGQTWKADCVNSLPVNGKVHSGMHNFIEFIECLHSFARDHFPCPFQPVNRR